METFDNYLFKATATPRNRREIRAMIQDRKRFEPLLKEAGDVIEESIKSVNECDSDINRLKLYNLGLDRFNAICDVIELIKHPKYWKLNRKFYTEIVKPVV